VAERRVFFQGVQGVDTNASAQAGEVRVELALDAP
jgi:hypothetical protein